MNQALIDAIKKFQNDSGLFAGMTAEAFVAGLSVVTAADWNGLSSPLRIDAINIFGLAGVPLPAGVVSPSGDLGPYTPTAMQWTTKDGVNFLRDFDTNYNAEGIAMSYIESMRDGSGTQKLYDHRQSDLWNLLHGRWRSEKDPTGAIVPGGVLTVFDRGFWWTPDNTPTAPNWQLHGGNGPPQFPRLPDAPPAPAPTVLTAADHDFWWTPAHEPTAPNWQLFAGFGPPQFPA
jgi:hypothetical protein